MLGLRPGYARAALWQVECDAAGVVPPGLSSVAGLLPVTSPPGTAPLRFDCTTSGDIIFAGGIWTVAPLHPPPPPPPPPGFGVAPGFGQMVTVPDASTLLSSDSATIDFLRTLAGQLNANSLGFSGAARDATSMWISDANDGLTDVQPVTVKLSKRADLANHQFVLDQGTHLTTYKRGAGAPTGNLLSSPLDQASLRAAIFEMPMLADEKARMQRACKRPSVWSNPPLLTAAEKALLGDKESTDTSLREQQEAKCKQNSSCFASAIFSGHAWRAHRWHPRRRCACHARPMPRHSCGRAVRRLPSRGVRRHSASETAQNAFAPGCFGLSTLG